MDRLGCVSHALALTLALSVGACKEEETQAPVSGSGQISTDAALYMFITQTQPFASYILFPNADSVTSGTLNGSNAHQPLVRVSMNPTAFTTLRGDTLPAGTIFPDGAVVFKQIIQNGEVVLYAIAYRDAGSPLAAGGWLWAEYTPDGSTVYSITQRGGGCIDCHSREKGPLNNFIRTFERQH